MDKSARIYNQTVGHPLNRLLFTFVYAMVLAPWNKPAVFIVSLAILLVVYLFLFGVDLLMILGYVAAYCTGWVVGRIILPSYEADPFGGRGVPPGGDHAAPLSDPYEDVITFFAALIDAAP